MSNITKRFLALVILGYGIATAYFAYLAIGLFSVGFLKDPVNLMLSKMLFLLAVLYAVSGVTLLFLKRWGKTLLLAVSPFFLSIMLLGLAYSAYMGKGLSFDVPTIAVILFPIIFVYGLTHKKRKYFLE